METNMDQNVKRPKGVWILTIWILVMAGLVPLIALALFFINGSGFNNVYQLIFSVLVALGVIISAISAWAGIKRAKNFLVVFSLIHYLLLAYQNGLIAYRELVPTDRLALTWGRSIRSIVYSVIIIWYFYISKKTDKFYEQKRIS